MTTLSETIKARLEPELRVLLDREAERQERPYGHLVRRYVREGLKRDHERRAKGERVGAS